MFAVCSYLIPLKYEHQNNVTLMEKRNHVIIAIVAPRISTGVVLFLN